MNQISALPNPLEILFQEYNHGRIESVGFRSFTLHAGESNSYRTLKSALIVPVSGRAIFSFEHEPFIAKRGLFLHGCPDKTLTISALGEQDFHYINMYYENDRPLLFSHKLKNPERTFSILEQILKIPPDADIRSQYQQEKLTEEFFAQIFADFQPEETYNESQIMSILLDFIAEHGMSLKETARGGARSKKTVLYAKESELIEDCLTYIGAANHSMEIMQVKIVKDFRNRVNRSVNCENANLDKTVAASNKSTADIEYIFSTMGADWLSPDLRETARLRVENPEMSLSELCGIFPEKIFLTHQFHKIHQISLRLTSKCRLDHPVSFHLRNRRF